MFSAFVLISCKSEKEKNLQNIQEGVRLFIENTAFKNNEKIEIIELKAIDYREIGQFEIDSVKRIFVLNHINTIFDKIEGFHKQARENSTKGKFYESMGMDGTKYHQEALKEALSAKVYIDSTELYKNLVEKLSSTPKDTPKSHYLTKSFIKASLPNRNWLDTVKYVLDKDFRVIEFKMPTPGS